MFGIGSWTAASSSRLKELSVGLLVHINEEYLNYEEIHMRINSLLKKTLLITSVAGMLLPGLGVAAAFKGTDCVSETKRPLSDFLDAQGANSSFFPPVPSTGKPRWFGS